MELGEKQELFSVCLAKLILYIDSQGWKARLGDGCILPERKIYVNGATVRGQDRVHMNPGCHYYLLAQDINLFVDGEWITDGGDPKWGLLADFWRNLDPLCTPGYDFGDSNHFSIGHNGKR